MGELINYWQQLSTKRGKTMEGFFLDNKDMQRSTSYLFDFFETQHLLTKESKVLELGCNLGRNLREAKNRYGCFVVGYDFNEYVIQENRKFFKENGEFHIEDVLKNSSVLNRYDDGHFDLGITMSFLQHVPRGNEKKYMIQEFLRICKSVCMLEIDKKAEDIVSINKVNNTIDVVVFEDYRKYDDRIGRVNNSCRADRSLYYYNSTKPNLAEGSYIENDKNNRIA